MSAYSQLLEHLADHEPRRGYQLPSELPPITDADTALVLRHDPSIACEVFATVDQVEAIARAYADPKLSPPVRCAGLGALFAASLGDAVREHLLLEVRNLCSQRRAEADPRRAYLSDHEIISVDFGVAELLR